MNDDRIDLTRRDFVRGTIGAALASSVFGFDREAMAGVPALPRPPRQATVALVRDQKALNETHEVNAPVLKQMLADAVMLLTGERTPKLAWLSLVHPNDVVGLVDTPHLNPTHREVTEAVRAGLVEAGIAADRIRNAQGGIDKVKPCTALIGLPALKAHWLTGLGTVMKLYILYSGAPSRYHDTDNVKLGEIWHLPDVKGKTRLVLVDALRPLCDKGPQPDPRYLWDYKGLIAGVDPVAVDTTCLRIIMAKRQALRGEPWPISPPPLSVAAADERYGLGTSRVEEIMLKRHGWTEEALI